MIGHFASDTPSSASPSSLVVTDRPPTNSTASSHIPTSQSSETRPSRIQGKASNPCSLALVLHGRSRLRGSSGSSGFLWPLRLIAEDVYLPISIVPIRLCLAMQYQRNEKWPPFDVVGWSSTPYCTCALGKVGVRRPCLEMRRGWEMKEMS